MAFKRMFDKRITNAAKFLKLPHSAQTLYLHLNMNADDDGIVEGYTVLCMCKASESDIDLLQEKGYLTVLNDDYVLYLEDWNDNNYIREDRKKDSVYKELLDKYLKSKTPEEPDVPIIGDSSADEAADIISYAEPIFDGQDDKNSQAAGKKAKKLAKNTADEVCPSNVRQMSVTCPQNDRLDLDLDSDIDLDIGLREGESNNIYNIKGQEPTPPPKSSPYSQSLGLNYQILGGTLTKKQYGVFKNVLLTDDERKTLTEDKEKYIDKLSCYLKNNPNKHYNDHYATIVSWIIDDSTPKDSRGKPKTKGKKSLSTSREYDFDDLNKKIFK